MKTALLLSLQTPLEWTSCTIPPPLLSLHFAFCFRWSYVFLRILFYCHWLASARFSPGVHGSLILLCREMKRQFNFIARSVKRHYHVRRSHI